MRSEAGIGKPRFRPRFFLPESATRGGMPRPGAVVLLDPADSHHARDVLRLCVGSKCEVVLQSEGGVYDAELVGIEAGVAVRLGSSLQEDSAAAGLTILLAQSVSTPSKIDLVIEKGTEVGIDQFLFFPDTRSPRSDSERLAARVSRWRRLAREAAKQSRQEGVPEVYAAGSLADARAVVDGEGWWSLVLEPSAERTLHDLSDSLVGFRALALWVGSEPGWSEGELEQLSAAPGCMVKLGRRILRTETAGPVAAAVVRFALSDW